MSSDSSKLLAATLLLSLSVMSQADTNHFRSINQVANTDKLSSYSISLSGTNARTENRVRQRQSDTPPVYPGCRVYSEDSGAGTLVLDDSEPRTLQELFDDGTILPGMVVILRRAESTLFLSEWHNQNFSSDKAEWLTIKGEGQGSIGSVDIRGVKNIRFTGLRLENKEPINIFYTSGTEGIIVDNSYFTSGDDFESWDFQEWKDIANGIHFDRSKCSTAYNNELANLRFGITVYTYDEEMDAEVQSQKALIEDNFLRNISADFLRPIGSDITINANTGIDHYVSEEDGDANHDDFIQGFAYPVGTEFNNVKITNNFYQASTDRARNYQSSGQGIVILDGLYTNFEVSNNTLISDHYHGITILWGRNGLIKNNTAMVMDDTSGKYMWISSNPDKSGEHPPENVKVINNVINLMKLDDATAKRSQNNVVIDRTVLASELVKYDVEDLNFNVAVKQNSEYFVSGTGSSITTLDEAQK